MKHKQYRVKALLILAVFCLLCIGAPKGAVAGNKVEFVAAGAPKSLVQKREYSKLFQHLSSNKIMNFFPTFQYQEVPAPKSFGFEAEFSSGCKSQGSAIAALRASNVKVIVPAELVYPNPRSIGKGNIKNDPLSKIIACIGRDKIRGVTNYDEAPYQGVPISAVQALYQRVKAIDPTLDVIMVHGPIVMDQRQFRSENKRRSYLAKVKQYAQFSDIVGFDVYPFPREIAKLASPISNGEIGNPVTTVEGYLKWMKLAWPNKQKLLTLQGFGYANMYEKNWLRKNVPQELIDLAQSPNLNELTQVVQLAKANDVDMIIWWGQASLTDSNTAPWSHIRKLGKAHGR